MVTRYEDPNHPFMSEARFRRWVWESMSGQGWHCQPLEDMHSIGIPDISAAHPTIGRDVWMELKLGRGARDVNSLPLHRYPPTAQQLAWLKNRQLANGGSPCGILVGWTTGPNHLDFVTWVPIENWKLEQTRTLFSWGLSPHGSQLSHLQAGECTILDLILGRSTTTGGV